MIASESRRKMYESRHLESAISAVIIGELSSYTAVRFKVQRATISRHVAHYNKTHERLTIGQGRPTRLSHEEESLLVTILQTRASAGFTMDKSELVELITNYLINAGKDKLLVKIN